MCACAYTHTLSCFCEMCVHLSAAWYTLSKRHVQRCLKECSLHGWIPFVSFQCDTVHTVLSVTHSSGHIGSLCGHGVQHCCGVYTEQQENQTESSEIITTTPAQRPPDPRTGTRCQSLSSSVTLLSNRLQHSLKYFFPSAKYRKNIVLFPKDWAGAPAGMGVQYLYSFVTQYIWISEYFKSFVQEKKKKGLLCGSWRWRK